MSLRGGVRYFPNTNTDLTVDEKPHVPENSIEQALENIEDNLSASFKATEENGVNGIYLGTAGVSYMYYHLSKSPHMANKQQEYLNKAVEYLLPALKWTKYPDKNNEPAFLLGYGGIYALAAVIYKALNFCEQSNKYHTKFYEAAKHCKGIDYLNCGSDELLVGRAGYIAGALWLAKETNTDMKLQEIHDICKVVVESGRSYARSHRSPAPLMYSYYQVEYLGAAHGLSGILQMLLSVPGYLESNPSDAKDIKATIDYLLSLQDSEGNFPCDLGEVNQHHNELVHWCHGAPGVIYLMAKAYLLWGDAKYLKCCEQCAHLVWNKGLLKKGPGICHGIAGNGYVFLLLHRLTNDVKYLHKAIAFAKFMETDAFKKEANIPDNPYSLYEGVAGTACFLVDILQPDKAEFPFFDVFD